MLNLQHLGESKCDAFFNVCNNVVSVIPLTDDCRKYVLSGDNNDSNEKNNWLYGFAEDSCSVAFVQKSRFSVGVYSHVDLRVSKFYTPIIIKSTQPGADLSAFDSIEFYGGIVDILFPTAIAIKEDYDNRTITFRSQDEYKKTYDVAINNEKFKVTYSISYEDLSSDTGKLPDLRENIHSILRFDFDEPKSLSEIEKYYSYAMCLFQFCTGHLNVWFEIRLRKNETYRGQHIANPAPILVSYNNGFDDYVNELLDLTKVIRLQFLGDSFPSLLKTLCEAETAPHLLFLPKRNSENSSIVYTFISSICIAFEKEYGLLTFDRNQGLKEESEQLTKELLNVVDKSNVSEMVCNKARNILNSQLKNFSPSLKEKVINIYGEFEHDLKTITEQCNHNKLGVSAFYSSEEFEKKISKFINMRNKASHSEIIWNEGIDIFIHLKILVYFCILKRAGYESKQSACILSNLFGRFF